MFKILLLSIFFVAGDGLDEATQNRLIEKLTQVNLNLAPNDSSKVSIALRLGDLHAERGRRLANEELNKGCATCTAGNKDRQQAIDYYTDVLPKLENEQKSRVLTQMGHLFELTGKETKAIGIYEGLLKNESAGIAAEANLSLAEIYFKKRAYSQALNYYEKVKRTHPSQKGLATYRAGWCLFNMNQIEKAAAELREVLNSPELLSRNSGGAVSLDKQFQEEVSRDYATFISRLPFNEKYIAELYNLSPDNAKLAHTSYLASEYERLGQVPAAIAAWRFAIERQSEPKARLEGHVHLAQLQAQHQQRENAVKDFSTSLAIWKTLGSCADDTCKNLKIRLKQFIVDWSTLEKKAPSSELLDSYKKYLAVFSEEHDLRLWQAQAASQKGEFEYAIEQNLYVADAITAEKTKGTKLSDQQKTWLETALLAAIENAELSKKPENIDKTTTSYLAKSIDRKKETDVRYQRAQMAYEAANYQVAADRFRELALDKKAPTDIRSKSADLTLDSLVLLKDDLKLEAWSKELAKALPSQSTSLMSVARKSVLTQSSQMATNNNLNDAWLVLGRFEMKGANPEEKTTYLKNKLILAEKLNKLSDARDAAEQLLRQPNITEVDREFALSRKAWLAELQFDFTTALAATEKMKMEGQKEQKFLKLAVLADLAGKDATGYYRSYLKVSKDKERAIAVASELVRKSNYSLKELDAQKKILEQEPEALARMTYEAYASSGNTKLLERLVSDKKLNETHYGLAAFRSQMLGQYGALKARLQKSTIDTSTQKKLAASLKNRVALLTEGEKMAAKAVDQEEWASQVVYLGLLADEHQRFYNEVLSLPVPEGLAPEEEQEYLSLLSQQAAPHQTKANDIKGKLSEIYAKADSFTKYRAVIDEQDQPIRKVFIQEMAVLKSALPQDQQAKLVDVAPERALASKPSLAQMETARQEVREKPFDRSSIKNLIGLERQMGRESMVSYLESRLSSLENTESTKK
jgi:hypothetical protein